MHCGICERGQLKLCKKQGWGEYRFYEYEYEYKYLNMCVRVRVQALEHQMSTSSGRVRILVDEYE